MLWQIVLCSGMRLDKESGRRLSNRKHAVKMQTEVGKLQVFQAQCVAHTIEIDRNSDMSQCTAAKAMY